VKGLVSGIGVATADAAYCAVAAFGVSAVANVMIGQRAWLELAGGSALIVLGVRALLVPQSSSLEDGTSAAAGGLLGAYASTLALTITNPATIISFAAVSAALGLGGGGGGYLLPGSLVAGVLAGSAAWWLVLASAAAALRARITARALRVLGAASAVAFLAFGLVAVIAFAGGR
jgi:threonine/homoserine/homoserine lactone efflux protein